MEKHDITALVTARLDRLPLSRYHYKMIGICGATWAFDAFDIALITFVATALAQAWNLSPGEMGIVLSSGLIGMIAGAFLGGIAGDRMGRKAVLKWTMLVFSVASLGCAIAWDIYSLVFFRFIVGLGLGGLPPIIYTLMGEITPARDRGKTQGLLTTFWTVGWILAALLAYFVIAGLEDGWRWAFVAGATPALYLFIVQRYIPESARWLAMKGRKEEALAIVDDIERQVAKTDVIPPLTEDMIKKDVVAPQKPSFGALYSVNYRRVTIMLMILWFLNMFGYYGLFSWLPSLLMKSGRTMEQSFLYSIFLQLAYLPNQVLVAFLMDKYGRKPVLIGNLLCGFLATLAFGWALGLPTLESFHIIGLGVVTSFFISGIIAVSYTYTPELYPTAFRATGAAMGSACSRVGGMVSPIAIGYAMGIIGITGAVSLVAGAFILAAVTVGVMGIETKGKAL
ncbi:MFS transporter [Sporomusa sphaeroides DSM 2875]|uniref:MFS transporter n=1 Tax=Sporomusa sphaeroides TaxID=47679 RepID=UPI002030E8A2|nr:MFS transporter [Sporomusa sphaeroides DSM 2875]